MAVEYPERDPEATVSEDEAAQGPGQRQEVHSDRDTYVAGRDIVLPAPKASALLRLGASEGADLLAELSSGDQTLGKAKAELTDVSPRVSAPALKMLLGRDEDLVIALLASIPEATTEVLVSAMTARGARLDELLTAIEAINQCESHAGRAIGKRVGWFRRTTSFRGTKGFLQRYANGAIHWSPGHGAFETTESIASYHHKAGGSEGLLGFPVSVAKEGVHPRTGTECRWQDFEGPSDYSVEVRDYVGVRCGASVISSPKLGTHATWGAIGEFSELGWRDRSWAGLPVGDMISVGPSRGEDGTGTSGLRQPFESGVVYYSDKTGAIRVPRRWANYFERRGGAAGPLGFPVSPEIDAAKSPRGTKGSFQRFEGLWEYPEDILSRWSDRELSGGATIYHSREHGAHSVAAGNGVLYERLNGTASWLGFPTSDEKDVSAEAGEPGRTIQSFEGGAIFYSDKYDSVLVRREIVDHLAEFTRSVERLGFPVSEAEPLASGGDDCIQFFERGVVTARDKKIQVWLSPVEGSSV